MNHNEFRLFRRKLWRLLTSKMVIWPTMFGAVSICFGVSGGRVLGPWGVAGIAGLVVGIGTAVKRWISDGERLADQAWTDIQRAANKEHDRYLRNLRKKLRRDRDPRTSQMARKMQQVHRRLQLSGGCQSRGSTKMFGELHDQAKKLYQSCLRLLERSLQLWQVAIDVATPQVREELMKSRELLVAEVEQSVDHLERTLDHLQTAQLRQREEGRHEAARLRDELDQGLEVARRVEQRIDDLEKDLRINQRV